VKLGTIESVDALRRSGRFAVTIEREVAQ